MALDYTGQLARTRSFLMESGSTIWSDADLMGSIRQSLHEINLILRQVYTLNGLDEAASTTLPSTLEGVLTVGSGIYAVSARAVDRAEAFELANESGSLNEWLKIQKGIFGVMMAKALAAALKAAELARVGDLRTSAGPANAVWPDDFGEQPTTPRASGSILTRILATRAAKLMAVLPLDDWIGTVARNKAPGRLGYNMVKNPGFEDVSGIDSAFWTANLDGGQIYPQPGGGAHSGVNGLAIISGGVGKDTHAWQYVPVTPGLSYTFKAWTFGNGTVGLKLRIARGDFTGWILNVDTNKTGGVYSQYVTTFTNPSDNPNLYIQLACPGAAGGWLYVDDVELYANTPDPSVFDGTYKGGFSLEQPGYSGGSVLLDGSTGYVAMDRGAIGNYLPAAAGSYVIYGKTTLAALADGYSRWLVKFKSNDALNYIDCFKFLNNLVGWQFRDDSCGAQFETVAWTAADWFSIGSTWSTSGGLDYFLNGELVVHSHAAVGGMMSSPVNYGNMSLGWGLDNPNGQWVGNLQNFALWDAKLNTTEMRYIGRL